MNVVIFASDAKGLSSLNSVIEEASRSKLNVFAIVTNSTTLKYTPYQISDFQILSNVKSYETVRSTTLGIDLPFIPDWLLVARERWEPEESIIREFKYKFKCKVGLVEPNSWILGAIEARLETESRNRFKDLIDVFFTHSTHSVKVQQALGFKGTMAVVGNPKYDNNLSQSEETLKEIKEYYKVDDSKEQVLFFSLINSSRPEINTYFKEYIKYFPKCQFYYKPYPGEPFDDRFQKDYYPEFFLENCTPILDETHIWPMLNICNTHIGCLTSISHSSLLLGKTYIDLSQYLEIDKKYVDISQILKEDGPGVENNVGLWMGVFNLTSKEELKDMLNSQVVGAIKDINQEVWGSLNKREKLLTLFDDFNDKQASKRIINHIQNEISG
jgi:hypothetical protein